MSLVVIAQYCWCGTLSTAIWLHQWQYGYMTPVYPSVSDLSMSFKAKVGIGMVWIGCGCSRRSRYPDMANCGGKRLAGPCLSQVYLYLCGGNNNPNTRDRLMKAKESYVCGYCFGS